MNLHYTLLGALTNVYFKLVQKLDYYFLCLYITHIKFNNCDERIKIMKWLRKIAKNSQEVIFVLYYRYKKFLK